ncbi:MAG: phage major capsid protein [Oricola sp.]|nr:MAG: phage major capsid protein [Oricola sp.]
MLESLKIQRRQSEIRQQLAELVGKDKPEEAETRQMADLDAEYRQNETRYRAALIAEDDQRQEAGKDLETREDREWSDLVGKFELRQVALALDEGRTMDGPTAEIVAEMRAGGGYKGVPVPLEALLETRAGETVAGGTPDPVRTAPIIDRLFADSVAARMGVRTVNIPFGTNDYPIVTSSVAAGWADGELADVAGPTVFATTDSELAPDHNLGVQMEISRKAMKQSGPGLEQAVRRDMSEAIRTALDRAVFLGAGSSGEPTGIFTAADGAGGITDTTIDAAASWSIFRSAIVRFMTANAASSPGQVNILIRPEVWDALDGTYLETSGGEPVTGDTEWSFLTRNVPVSNIVMSSNAVAAPTGSPAASKALLTTTAGGVAPALVGIWGGVDLIRDPYTLAASGQLKLTGLLTADVAILRAAQLEVLEGIQ